MRPQLTEKNRVTIRIWTSQDNTIFPGTSSRGHVSLQLPSDLDLAIAATTEEDSNYISFHPKGPVITPAEADAYKKSCQLNKWIMDAKKFLKIIAPEFKTYEEDCHVSASLPEVTICLYNLNTKAMMKKFNELKQGADFSLFSPTNNYIQRLLDQGESCSSFAFRLLKAGGLTIPTTLSSEASSYFDPDKLLNVVLENKRQELNQFPYFRNFKFQRPIDFFEIEEVEEETKLPSPRAWYSFFQSRPKSTALAAAGATLLVAGAVYYFKN